MDTNYDDAFFVSESPHYSTAGVSIALTSFFIVVVLFITLAAFGPWPSNHFYCGL